MKGTQEQQVKTKNNSKAMLHFIAIVLTVTTIVSLAIGLFAWSKYTANINGNANAAVAKWNFNLSLKSGSTTVTANQTLNLATTQYETSSHIADGKIAPGTSGTFDIEIDTLGTEVSMLYDVTIGMTNCPRNITFSKKGPGESSFTVISPMQTGDTNERTRTISFSKYLTLNDVTTANTNDTTFVETIKWEWPYELTSGTDDEKTAYDNRDKADSGITATLNITATGTEVMNTPLSTIAITDGNSNTINNGDTVDVYAGGTTTINIPAGAEGVTISSSDTTKATVSTSTNAQTGVTTGTITGVAAGNAVITITGQETGKTTSVNINVKPAITAQIDGTDTVLTQQNTGSYYGSVVTNYKVNNEDYQLFFIDYEGKYGAGKGAIFLKKKDKVPNIACTLSNKTNYDLPEMLIDEMNPAWKAKNGTIDQNNEKAVAWLCDTEVWSSYAVGDYARYAIGGPSIEMYVDSYNEAKTASNVGGTATWGFADNANGYSYGGSRVATAGKNNMYTTDYYWLASPNYDGTSRLIHAHADGFSFYNYNGISGVAPLVCLQSDFPLQLSTGNN